MTVLEYMERRKIDGKKRIRLPGPHIRASITAIRREENIRAREKRYGVKRGETVHIIIDIKDEGRRTVKVSRRMQVVNLYEYHILLRHVTGAQESYQYQEFMQMWDRR